MEDSRREVLTRIGVNIEEALDRFVGKEDLLVLFLKKFAKDSSYESLKAAMAEKQYEDAFEAAHALKGICGNLSIVHLFEVVCKEVEFLRAKQYSQADEWYPEVVKEYERVIEELKNL